MAFNIHYTSVVRVCYVVVWETAMASITSNSIPGIIVAKLT